MTTIGHGLTGLTLAVLSRPQWLVSRKQKIFYYGAFVVLANLPDLSLPMWGHDRYDISHSVIVNGALLILMTSLVVAHRQLRRWVGGAPVILGAALAWSSHFVLDSTYNHGHGLAVLWPVSGWRLNLSLPWFSTLDGWWSFDLHTLRVAAIEVSFYGMAFVIALALRHLMARWTPERSS